MTLLEKSLIFIPTIYKNIHTHDESIKKSFDDLCKALGKRFTNLVDYAQPAEFWNKYRTSKVANNVNNNKKRKTPKKKKCKTKSDTDEEDDDDSKDDEDLKNDDEEFVETDDKSYRKKLSEELESNDDEEDVNEPLIKRSKKKSIISTEISMDYIFKPNI